MWGHEAASSPLLQREYFGFHGHWPMQFRIGPLICPSPIGYPPRTAAVAAQRCGLRHRFWISYQSLERAECHRINCWSVFLKNSHGTLHTSQTDISEWCHTRANFSLQAVAISWTVETNYVSDASSGSHATTIHTRPANLLILPPS